MIIKRMMAEQLTNSDRVVVLSEEYAKKADGFRGGVGVEYDYH